MAQSFDKPQKIEEEILRISPEPLPYYTLLDFIDGELGVEETSIFIDFLRENPSYLQIMEGILAFKKNTNSNREELEKFLTKASKDFPLP